VSSPKKRWNLSIHRESVDFQFREDQAPINRNLKGASARFDALDFGIRKSGLDLGSQTDCLRQIVSLHAVLNDDLHVRSLVGTAITMRSSVSVQIPRLSLG
jgi:hypothetical protein